MKKVMLVLTSVLTLSAGVLSVGGGASAAEPPTKRVVLENTAETENTVETITIVEEFDSKGNVTSEEVISTDGLTPADFGGTEALTSGGSILGTPSQGGIAPAAVVVDSPNYDWKKIDTWKGDSKKLSTLKEWVYHFGAAVIPALISKNVWAGSAGGATYNTFVKPPAIRYYTNHIYQSQDYYYVYGRVVAKEYTDSARTKHKKTLTHVYRTNK